MPTSFDVIRVLSRAGGDFLSGGVSRMTSSSVDYTEYRRYGGGSTRDADTVRCSNKIQSCI